MTSNHHLPSSDVIHLFYAAGWYRGRNVELPESVVSSVGLEHPAAVILQAYAGLNVGDTGTGIECASSDISFRPIESSAEDRLLVEWSLLLKSQLVGVGSAHRDHMDLFVDESGRCFALDVSDGMSWVGDTMSEAARKLLLGIRMKPLLPPEEPFVWAYGEKIARGDPRSYAYA